VSEQQSDKPSEQQSGRPSEQQPAKPPAKPSTKPSEKQPEGQSENHPDQSSGNSRPRDLDDLLNRWHHDADTIPACDSKDVNVTVRWHQAGRGLLGEIIVENVGSRACLLNLKPTLIPLARDGRPLPARSSVTLNLHLPAHVVLEPGKRAVAPVSWRSWCGVSAGRGAIVEWWAGESTRVSVRATVEGPVQPDCTRAPSSGPTASWFTPAE
jgi:hypothetical protein